MDCGSPSPILISNDNELFITFYVDKQSSSAIQQDRNTIYDTSNFDLKFNMYLQYSFGISGDETIHGHPYNNLGMKSYSFYELKNSDFIKSLQDIDQLHPQYNPKKWEMCRHYILTFHDNMFECIAQGFEVREENTSLYNQADIMLNQLKV